MRVRAITKGFLGYTLSSTTFSVVLDAGRISINSPPLIYHQSGSTTKPLLGIHKVADTVLFTSNQP